ncbi:MAG: GGDEF domain-containing protein [Pseudomonadales bacterium]|nr:GGDEF domain-containing protein [Pseudomonadales bacterium]
MELDPRTFILAVTVVASVIAVVFFIFARNFPEPIKGFRVWAIALLVGVAAAAMMGSRGVIPDAYSIVLGNALYPISIALMIAAISIFNNDLIPWKIPWLCVAIVLFGMTYSLGEENGVVIRVHVGSWTNIVLLGLAIWTLLKRLDEKQLRMGVYFTCASFTLTTVIALARIITYIGWGGGYVDLLNENSLQKVYVVSQCLNMLLVSVGFGIMGQEKLVESYYALATSDALTGLRNRRHFLNVAEQEIQRAERYQRNASLLLIDIDHFKAINDIHGPETGDNVIKDIAEVMRESFREIDIHGRYEGGKFIALLPETHRAGAEVIAERIRVVLHMRRVEYNGGEVCYGASFGIAQLQPGMSLDQLITQANHALYQAKDNGRNRVETFSVETVSSTWPEYS